MGAESTGVAGKSGAFSSSSQFKRQNGGGASLGARPQPPPLPPLRSGVVHQTCYRCWSPSPFHFLSCISVCPGGMTIARHSAYLKTPPRPLFFGHVIYGRLLRRFVIGNRPRPRASSLRRYARRGGSCRVMQWVQERQETWVVPPVADKDTPDVLRYGGQGRAAR